MLSFSRLLQALTPHAGTPIGGMMSLTIADATPIDPVSSIGANGSGWVAICKLRGLTSLVGAIDATKLTINVTDPGYDTSGNVTTVSRTITGVTFIRRQYPNATSKMISTDGTDLTIYISLGDWVYTGTTIVSASIASGFYPACVAGATPTKVNSSVRPYTKPIFNWINYPQERVGASVDFEGLAFHERAMNGQQVACIKSVASDGTNSSATITTSAPQLSSKITQGFPPEVWKASHSTAALTQGIMGTVDVSVYPWIGDSSAVYTLSTNGNSWPTALPVPLRFFNDKTGAYGGGYAYVKVGAGGGTSSATPATAAADPYPTLAAALTGVKAWNNTNKSHNDLGGATVRFMDDGASGPSNHSIGVAGVNSPGSTWCVIEKDPAAVGAVSITYTAQVTMPHLCLWRNLIHTIGTITYNWLGPNTVRSLWVSEGCTIDNTNNKQICDQFAQRYWYNLTLTGTQKVSLHGLAPADSNLVLMAGVVGTLAATPNSAGGPCTPIMLVGCNLPGYFPMETTPTPTDGLDGRIIFNNKMLGGTVIGGVANLSLGFVNVQNVYERVAVTVCENLFADGTLFSVANYIEMYNTAVGERCSRMYNDVAGTKIVPNGLSKIGTSKYCIWDNYNIKSDTFNTGAGSVGNWAYSHSVGNVGNVSLFGLVTRGASDKPDNTVADTPFLGNAWLPSSEYNMQRATGPNLTQAQIMAMFTNYTVQPQGVPAAGGNYLPLSGDTNATTYLRGRVPNGGAGLKYDLAGTARRNDGTGAAGAYEF